MLGFAEKHFRTGVEIILWLLLISLTVYGGMSGYAYSYSGRVSNSILGAIVGLAIGLVVSILLGGLISKIILKDKHKAEEEAKFCPECGCALQGEPADTKDNTPVLWNPRAAVWWSLFFVPLGPILHYINWKALGKDKEARQAIKMAIFFLVLTIISFLPFIPIPDSFFWWPVLGWFVWGWGWFIKSSLEKFELKGEPTMGVTGKGQIEYVENGIMIYKKKSWLVPVLSILIYYGWSILHILGI